MSETEPIRILVADDHPVVRDGLSAMLGTQADLVVVGEADSGEAVLAEVARARPDVVLLDLEMPGLDGLEALRRLQAERPDLGVIVFTAFDADDRILGAVRAGARGYLLKGAPRDEVFRAIRVVAAGGSLLQPVVTSRLLDHLRRGEVRQAAAPANLTARELQVLSAMAEGRTNRAIAQQLSITERTVKFHVGAILAKLQATNRTEAVATATRLGMLP
jgi:DNA-binding NarL/FixJ family response regulator